MNLGLTQADLCSTIRHLHLQPAKSLKSALFWEFARLPLTDSTDLRIWAGVLHPVPRLTHLSHMNKRSQGRVIAVTAGALRTPRRRCPRCWREWCPHPRRLTRCLMQQKLRNTPPQVTFLPTPPPPRAPPPYTSNPTCAYRAVLHTQMQVVIEDGVDIAVPFIATPRPADGPPDLTSVVRVTVVLPLLASSVEGQSDRGSAV